MKAICENCGSEFEYHAFFAGATERFKPGKCASCTIAQLFVGAAVARHREWDRECPKLYGLTDPKRLDQAKLAKVLNWAFGPQGLLLHGETGTGKTRMAVLLMKQLYLSGKSIKMFFGMDFAHECSKAFGEFTGEAWIDSFIKKDVLFFDDLGKFPLTERVEAELFGVIEHRLLNMRPIILTTNFVGDSLSGKMTPDRGAPLVRRLREFCGGIAF